jgi:hypothetical protein
METGEEDGDEMKDEKEMKRMDLGSVEPPSPEGRLPANYRCSTNHSQLSSLPCSNITPYIFHSHTIITIPHHSLLNVAGFIIPILLPATFQILNKHICFWQKSSAWMRKDQYSERK